METIETPAARDQAAAPINGAERDNDKGNGRKKPRAITNPNEVAQIVLAQMALVNAKKDDLTIAIKGLMDTYAQLARAYGEQARVTRELQGRVREHKGEEER